MSDPAVDRLLLRAGLLEDLAAAVRATAVTYVRNDTKISDPLATLADKLDLRRRALEEEAAEMAR